MLASAVPEAGAAARWSGLGDTVREGVGSRPRPRRIPRPRVGSLEYRLSWGLASIRADRAYARGVNGEGVTVAIVDTGISGVPRTVFGRVSDASIDLVPARTRGNVNARHGEETAGVAGGAFDGTGTMGVAFGATLLAIRADIDGSCETQCAVRGSDLARGIHYAIDHGAKVIGVPLVGGRRLQSVEPALERATAAGAIIVAAAGNDGAAAPAWPARYAADPRFARSIIVAGSSTIDGVVSRWSSKADATKDRYIAAPGENVLVNCDQRYCNVASGTSFSVAYVAGALTLIMAAHPALTGQEAGTILLAAAADRGARGADPINGTGVLDVAAALRVADRAAARPTG